MISRFGVDNQHRLGTVYKYLTLCQGCTHFCEPLYIFLLFIQYHKKNIALSGLSHSGFKNVCLWQSGLVSKCLGLAALVKFKIQNLFIQMCCKMLDLYQAYPLTYIAISLPNQLLIALFPNQWLLQAGHCKLQIKQNWSSTPDSVLT